MFGFGRKKKQEERVVYVTSCVFNCLKEKCPKWVKMFHHIKNEDGSAKTVEEGRCAEAWLPYLIVEQAERILGAINGNKK